MTTRWCLTNDDDGHWYVIPADRKDDFEHWVYETSVDTLQPSWIWNVNGHPNNVTFTAPEIFGDAVE